MSKLVEFFNPFKSKKVLSLAFVAILGTGFFFGQDSRKVDVFDNKDLKARSVKIVNLTKKSGGSGSIITSSPRESTILTNSHVCEVVVNGGLVITDKGEYAVTSYRQSERHDLCLITVGADLGINTRIALLAPDLQEEAAISGHPRLLPNVITRGHFSGKEMISVLTGIRPCTVEEEKSDMMFLCLFLGGIPEITVYEAQLVTALIQGGSSGSPVYNANGEIAAVAFAGSGDMSQAYVVPYEAVATFFEEELLTLKKKYPKMTQEFQLKRRRNEVTKERLSKLCNDPRMSDSSYKEVCSVSVIRGDLLWKH
jgi:S1-C subfamily serine protease